MRNPMIDLLKIVAEDPDWLSKLSAPPYSIHVKKHDSRPLYLFRYDMIETDFFSPGALAARGCIIEKTEAGAKVVCYPMSKFFNEGEKYAVLLDIDSAVAREKIDGSIIKLYYDAGGKGWTWATNNGFDASAELPGFLPVVDEESSRNCYTFGDLIKAAIENENEWMEDPEEFTEEDAFASLDKRCTYWFELTSPRNRIVVPYEETRLWFLGCRDNETFEEMDPEDAADRFGIVFTVPPKIDKATMEKWAKGDYDGAALKEGVVMYDKYFNRVKVKLQSYVTFHRLKGERQFSMEHLLDCVKDGTFDDVSAAFPEYKEKLAELSDMISAAKKKMFTAVLEGEALLLHDPGFDDRITRKVYAEWVLSKYPQYQSFLFAALKYKVDKAWDLFMEKLNYGKLEELSKG